MKKLVGSAALFAAAGSLLIGTATPAQAYATNYGAIAFSSSAGKIGWSSDFPDAASAASQAIGECNRSDCKVVARFSNGCGAVAYSRAKGTYTFGAASNLRTARKQALNRNNGDATITHWNCTSGYES
ncbi:DUF4189 domain-containing protein [Nocardia huaxiensis]|uniref:DUF4189 domain-containing protein n=1 Tax=Nocardia huaxiensis TaxID=2755382 RepID=A0A7D6Z309_9NOCA|nr:DUF4189 domain-containing protein [Nocardia huaxiensis]QLY29664.1 DUF4189 domain-containing protein [Nocardia huaxiensis]UFS96762.1 DUF4189 domain-containing protein [Nocardia huaxiensis]